jgi:hypothetical protein
MPLQGLRRRPFNHRVCLIRLKEEHRCSVRLCNCRRVLGFPRFQLAEGEASQIGKLDMPTSATARWPARL